MNPFLPRLPLVRVFYCSNSYSQEAVAYNFFQITTGDMKRNYGNPGSVAEITRFFLQHTHTHTPQPATCRQGWRTQCTL